MTDASDKESSGTFLRISNLPSILTEGIVIVLSILLAFAIDAYWDERKERVNESLVIEQLEKELKLYLRLLDQAGKTMTANLESIDNLLTVIHEGLEQDPAVTATNIARLQGRYRLADATATLKYLISDSTFNLFANRKLKDALSDASSFIALVHQFEDEETKFINDDYNPFVRKYIDWYSIKDYPRWIKETPPSRFESDISLLLESREFSNLLIERKSKARVVDLFRNQVRKAIIEALNELDANPNQ